MKIEFYLGKTKAGKITVEGEWQNPEFRKDLINFLNNLSKFSTDVYSNSAKKVKGENE